MPHAATVVRWALASVVVVAGATGPLPGAAPISASQLSEHAAARTTLADLKKLHDAGAVIVLDVRGADAYRQGHIPGAVLVPLETVGARAGEWKTATKPIVTYCS